MGRMVCAFLIFKWLHFGSDEIKKAVTEELKKQAADVYDAGSQ